MSMQTWVLVPVLSSVCCATLERSLSLSGPLLFVWKILIRAVVCCWLPHASHRAELFGSSHHYITEIIAILIFQMQDSAHTHPDGAELDVQATLYLSRSAMVRGLEYVIPNSPPL